MATLTLNTFAEYKRPVRKNNYFCKLVSNIRTESNDIHADNNAPKTP